MEPKDSSSLSIVDTSPAAASLLLAKTATNTSNTQNIAVKSSAELQGKGTETDTLEEDVAHHSDSSNSDGGGSGAALNDVDTSILHWGRDEMQEQQKELAAPPPTQSTGTTHQFGKNPPEDYKILLVDFLNSLTKKGYFRDFPSDSPEYKEKLKHAESMFALRHGWRLRVGSMEANSNSGSETSQDKAASLRAERMYRSFNHVYKKSKVASPRGDSGRSRALSMPLRPQRQKVSIRTDRAAGLSLMIAAAMQDKAVENEQLTDDDLLLPTLLARPDENKRLSPRNTSPVPLQLQTEAATGDDDDDDNNNSSDGSKRFFPTEKENNNDSSGDGRGDVPDAAEQKRGTPAPRKNLKNLTPTHSFADTSSDSDSDSSQQNSDTESETSETSSIDDTSRKSMPGLHQVHPSAERLPGLNSGFTPVSKRESGLQKWHGSKAESRLKHTEVDMGDDENIVTDVREFLQGKKPGFEWRLGDQIGSGAHGVVYRGLNQQTGALIAVKQIPIDGVTESHVVVVLQREVDILTQITHPNVVRFFGMEVRENYLHLLTEYVSGGSLADQLQQFGPMNEGLVKRHTRQILVGLEFLHSHGVVHRDIKGQNVLMTQQGLLKLADFGAAQTFDGIGTGQQQSLTGTPAFVAPEIILEHGHDDRADIWSLGCTIIQMLTAETPWGPLQFGSLYELLHHVAYGATFPPCAAPITQTLRDFLNLCLERDKTLRPAAGELLTHRLLLVTFDVGEGGGGGGGWGGGGGTKSDQHVVKVSPSPSLDDDGTGTPVKEGKVGSSPSSSPEVSPVALGMRDEDLIGLNNRHFEDDPDEIEVGIGGCCGCFHQLPSSSSAVRDVNNNNSGDRKNTAAKKRMEKASKIRVAAGSKESTDKELRYARGLRAQRKRNQHEYRWQNRGESSSKCAVQ